MTFRQYQKDASRTCADLGSEKLNLSHMIIGLYSEQNEIEDAKRKGDLINYGEELSDQNWYLANYCTYRNYAFEDFYIKMKESNFTLEEDLSKLSDLVKKFIAYGKTINEDIEQNLLERICFGFYEKYRIHNLNILQSFENNINKLKVRFPEKFTTENALNRDLVSERIELEK